MERRKTSSDRREIFGHYIAHDRRSGIVDRRSLSEKRLERAICNLIKFSRVYFIDEKN